jgi:putative hydrolase of the HAD superfamily
MPLLRSRLLSFAVPGIVVATFICPISSFAQSDGSAREPAASSAVAAPAQAITRPTTTQATSTPRATTTPAAPLIPPVTTPGAVLAPPASSTPPASTTPPTSSVAAAPAEDDSLPLGAAGLMALLLGGYAAYKARVRPKKEGAERGEDKGKRCFDIKKLLDQKLEELTDLKGRAKNYAESKVREGIRSAAEGSAAGELLALAEQAEKEYGRLKKLYEECITETGSGRKIKAVVFDFGGVIKFHPTGNVLENIARALGIPLPDFKRAYFEHNHLSNVGNEKWEDMLAKVVRVFDQSSEAERRAREIAREHFEAGRLNAELISWFSKLRKAGYKVGILSNATADLRARLEEDGIAPLAEAIVISGEIGHQKPHKEAFDVLFDKLGLLPHEVAFIDDSPKSLEKASEIGYAPILFKENAELREELRKLGVAFGESDPADMIQ